MKFLITFGLLLISLQSMAQYALALSESDQTMRLYKEANESLSSGNKKQALERFDQVIEFFETQGRSKELPENYMGMALSLAFTGHYTESIRYHKKALRAHRKYKSAESADEIRINLGLVYQLAGKEKKSRKYLGSFKFS
jgi:tetratricopeptide (TPR) repeat protein